MKITRRTFLAGSTGLASSLILPRHVRADTHSLIEGRAFGTNWRLTIPDSYNTQRLGPDVSALLERLENTLSPFRPNSELAHINSIVGNRPERLSANLSRLMRGSLAIADRTNGAFDPTLGPAVARFGFGPIRQTSEPEDCSAIGFRGLTLKGDMLTKSSRTLTFDPCGAGKGYALDFIGNYLRSLEINDFFLEFGGDILAGGQHSLRRPWRAGIEDPFPHIRKLRAVVILNNYALATSGDRVNAYSINGKRYCHIIDPLTREPVEHPVSSVSVIARDAITADGLATALMAMGLRRGADFAIKHNIPSMFISREGDHLSNQMAAGFETYLAGRKRNNG